MTISWRGCTNAGNGYINLAELLYTQNGQNVALNKVATSSGVWGTGYEAAKLVDGSNATMYHSNTAGSSTYWRVDLGVRCCLGLALPACLPARCV